MEIGGYDADVMLIRIMIVVANDGYENKLCIVRMTSHESHVSAFD